MANDNNLCTIYLFRHSQTEWNAQGKMQGHADSPLTELGVCQAQDASEKIKDIHFSAVFSSDLGRAIRTAELLTINRDLQVITRRALRERSLGKYEGVLAEEYHSQMKDLFAQYETLSYEEQLKFNLGDNHETDGEAVSRLITVLREIAVAYAGENVLAVSHGGSLRALLRHLGFESPHANKDLSMKNCGYIVLQSDGVEFFIKEVVGLKAED